MEPVVEDDPHPGEAALGLGHHQRHGGSGDLPDRQVAGTGDVVGEAGDVLALVAALRDLLATRPGLDRLAEHQHLRAGVVYVELAVDLVPGEGEQAGQRVAVGGVARAADMDRPGGVGADEFDVDPQRGVGHRGAPATAGCRDVGQRAGVPVVREGQVQEPGARDLCSRQPVTEAVGQGSRDPFGDFAGRLTGRLGQDERRVGRVIALSPGSRRLDRRRRGVGARYGLRRGLHYGGAQEAERVGLGRRSGQCGSAGAYP